jgi:hypothetical protein
MLDVCNYMRQVGLGREKVGKTHKIDAFMRVARNAAEVRIACSLFGGLALGVWLPESAQHQGKFWTVPPTGATGEGEPGSWGGHAIWMTGYDRNTIDFFTWGERYVMSWEFFLTYVDEAYAYVTEDFRYSTGKTSRGFNLEQLNGFLRELNS